MKRLLAAMLLCLPASLAPASLAHAELPAALVQKGSITFANVPNYPPMEFKDPATGKLMGFDIELGEALAAKLGLKAVWQETNFAQMLAALQTGRVDAILSGMSDVATRHDAASFVDYLHTSPQFLIQKSSAGELKTVKDLCGRKIGASQRTLYPKEIAAWSEANCPADKQAVFVGTNGSADARTQLKQGRVDASVQGSETMGYVIGQEPDAFVTLGAPFGAGGLNGLGLPKAEVGLQQAVAAALDAMIADGSYGKLLEKWNLTVNAVQKATINAGQ